MTLLVEHLKFGLGIEPWNWKFECGEGNDLFWWLAV